MSNFNLNKVDRWISVISIILIIVLLFVILLYLFMFNAGLSLNHSNWGEFGDFWGGIVGSIISLFAVILLFFTYRLQREELSKSTAALNNQNEQMNVQQFENIVFKLLDRKDEVINRMDFNNRHGIGAIKELNYALKKENFNNKSKSGNSDMKTLKKWWSNHKSYMWPFFNSVVSAINFIHTYQVNEIIRARLVQIYFNNFTLDEIRMVNNIFNLHVGDPNLVDARKFFNHNASSIINKL